MFCNMFHRPLYGIEVIYRGSYEKFELGMLNLYENVVCHVSIKLGAFYIDLSLFRGLDVKLMAQKKACHQI